MSRILKTILTVTIILTSFSSLYSQHIKGLSYNHAILNSQEKGEAMHLKSAADSIRFTDGFFEDFSTYRSSVYPKNNHFSDRYAFINSTWPDSMISLGVATLDAYDQNGFPWYSIDSGLVSSDTLTSLPFNFVGGAPETLFFSFFFQAGGKGDLPEGLISDVEGERGEDSLIVDFYAPGEEKWIQKFYTLDNTRPHQFNKVEIPLSDTFRVDGFRFRFRNYTSLQQNIEQGADLGMYANDDMWHIDYIQLRELKTSADTNQLGDIAITKPLLSSLTEYTAVPWRHFSLAQSAIERRSMPFTVQDYGANNGNAITFQRVYQTRNLITKEILRTRDLERDFSGFEAYTFMDDFTTGFYYNPDDTIGQMELRAFLETAVDQPRENDTVVRKETFYDHYAYDDGTAEAGYGIGGEYQDLNKIALRFRVFRRNTDPDYLRAVLIYFAKSIDSVSAEASYKIEIRKNDGAKPSSDTLFVSNTIYSPDYSTGINEFTRIEIDPPVALSDTFFIVIHQLDGYLNIGYDINTNNLHNLYNYVDSKWTRPTTQMGGTPMIRASFGTYSLPTEVHSVSNENDFTIYPNPTRDELNFQIPDKGTDPYLIQIYNILGSIQYSSLTVEGRISVSPLNTGVYLLVASSPDGRKRYSTKFIKE